MRLQWDDEDLCGAFTLAEHLAALDSVTPGTKKVDQRLEYMRIDIFSDALRLYAVSRKPEIIAFLKKIADTVGNARARTLVRKYLNEVERGQHTPEAIIDWANESLFRSTRSMIRMDPPEKGVPAENAPVNLATPVEQDRLIEMSAPKNALPPEEYGSWVAFYRAYESKIEELLLAIERKDLDRAYVLLCEIPANVPLHETLCDDVATLAIEQQKETTAAAIIGKMREGRKRALLLRDLYRMTKKETYRIDLIAAIEINGDDESDEHWKVQIARELTTICGDPRIGRRTEEQWQGKSPLARKMREEKMQREQRDALKVLLKRFRKNPALRLEVEQCAEALDDPAYSARALMDLWEKTNNPEHLAMARTAINYIPIDDDLGDGRARVLGDLASKTNEPNDLELWRQVIQLIGDPLDQLSELTNLCEVRAGIVE